MGIANDGKLLIRVTIIGGMPRGGINDHVPRLLACPGSLFLNRLPAKTFLNGILSVECQHVVERWGHLKVSNLAISNSNRPSFGVEKHAGSAKYIAQ